MKFKFKAALSLLGILGSSMLASAQYCTSGSTYNTDSDITRVVLNTLDVNTSNALCMNYSHNTTNTTVLDIGSSYPMSITLGVHSGCGGDFYDKSARVWIDLNKDGDFDDAGELMGSTIYSSGTFTSNFNITIPCSATPGITRMRVVCEEDFATGISPCGTYFYGETEDYNIELKAGLPPSANYTLPDTIYSSWVAQFTNVNQSGYTHQWFNSAVDPTLQTVSGTAANYSYNFNSPGTYSLKLVSTNCQGSAQITKQITVVAPTSIPEPEFVSSTNLYYYAGTPIDINFYDLSKYGPSSWEWTITPDIGSGAPWFWSVGDQYSQNPSAFFYDSGTYEVCLTVTNSLGSSNPLCKKAYITIAYPTGLNAINLMGQDFNGYLDSGYIFDSGGDGFNYGPNEFNEFVIQPCGASSVTLQFETFGTQNSVDVLSVYDGPNSAYPLLGTYSGTTLPNTITSTRGAMTLQFQSNNGTEDIGFRARWTSVIPQNGAPSADFILADTLFECASGTDAIVYNATTGVVPGQATYEWIMDYDSNVTYPKGYCDVCGDENAEWTYPALGFTEDYNIRLVISSCEGNDTMIRRVIVAPSALTPVVDFTASQRRIPAGGSVQFSEESKGACSRLWSILPASGWMVAPGSSLTDPVVEVIFNSAGSYHITLSVTNNNGTTDEEKTNYIDVVDYCTPIISIPTISDIGITEVKLNDMVNQTLSGQAPGYTSYVKTHNTSLLAGQSYSLTLKRKSPKVNTMTRMAWIDFNRDGDFDDQHEQVMMESNALTDTFRVTFTVPDYTTTVAGISRLRVSATLGNTPNLACGPAGVGEYEDYGIMLMHDDVPPSISLIGMDTVIMERHASYVEDGAQAFDNIEGNISNRIQISGTVDTAQAGIYFLSYDVKDASGVSAVTVKRMVIVSTDITAPQIALNGGGSIVHSVLTPFVEPGFTVTDNPGNAILSNNLVQVASNVNVNRIGDYQIRYKVSDANFNSTEVTRTVQVRDLDAPVISSASTVFWQVGAPFVNPVVLTDNYDANIQLQMTGSVNVGIFGTYEVTFNATDASGNSATPVTVFFTVGDSIRPVISTPPGTEIWEVNVNDIYYKEPKVSASDNYFPAVQLTRDASAVDIYTTGIYPIYYTATDGAGNTASFTRSLHVVDNEPPIVVAPPMNIFRWSVFNPLTDVYVSDNYNTHSWFEQNNKIQIVSNAVDPNTPGIYQIVYRAIDEAGNISALAVRYVNVREYGANSVEGVNAENAMEIYPNPSKGQFTIDLNTSFVSPEMKLQVMNAQGQLVYNANFVNQASVALDLTEFAKGVYLVRFESNGLSSTKRLVIH